MDNKDELTFRDLHNANAAREPYFTNAKGQHYAVGGTWTAADWIVAWVGEVGELCNEVKKLRRGDHTTGEEVASALKRIKEEAADIQIYFDRVCSALGVDLPQAIVEKFNRTSSQLSLPVFLTETGETVVRLREPGIPLARVLP